MGNCDYCHLIISKVFNINVIYILDFSYLRYKGLIKYLV